MSLELALALRWLGVGGLVPFFCGAVAVVTRQGDWALPALVAYGACILSFLGAVHWGWILAPASEAAPSAAVQRPRLPVARTLALGVVPSLVAWVALLLPADRGLGLLIIGLASWYLYERRMLGAAVLGEAYLALRQQLTFGAIGCLVVALVTR